MPTSEEIGKNLKKILRDKGITQKQLAHDLNIPQSTLSQWITGIYPIDVLHLADICNYLHISLTDITGQSDAQDDDDFFRSSTENIHIIARGMSRLSEEEQWRLLQLARVAFPKAFPEDHLE